jgi:hypothetical protein
MNNMTTEWMEFDKNQLYPNLLDRTKDECVVDIMLHSGEIIEMCQLKGVNFWSIEYGIINSIENVSKIKLTTGKIKRYKKHHWGSKAWCTRCNAFRIKPYPETCGIIEYWYRREADPNYEAKKKPKQPFGKSQEGYVIPAI